MEAGQWRQGDPDVLAVLDAGYDAPRIAHLLVGLPVEVLGRLRSDRVVHKPVPLPRICPPQGGRPPKHDGEFVFGRPETWGEVTAVTVTDTDRHRTATAQAWHRLHPPAHPAGGVARLDASSMRHAGLAGDHLADVADATEQGIHRINTNPRL